MKHHTIQLDSLRRWQPRGFSLVEVMIAMGVFAVGFVAVAAMFPAGLILQRETVIDVESQMVTRNATAMMRSRPMTFNLTGSGVDLGPTGSVDLQSFSGIASLSNRWQLKDRSYPTSQGAVDERNYYWVPMIRRTENPATSADWIVVIFVMKREGNLNYTTSPAYSAASKANATDPTTVPRVIGVAASVAGASRFTMPNDLHGGDGLADQVRPGDFVADNNGVVYKVKTADATGFDVYGGIPPGANRVWYAPHPKGASSPCTRVVLLSGVINEVK